MAKQHISKNRRLWLDIIVIGSAVMLTGFGIWHKPGQPSSSKSDVSCKPGSMQIVYLANDAFSTNRLSIKRCDTVKIIHQGTETYELALGEHDDHTTYPGFSLQVLRPNEYFIFDAIQAGNYTMHDHLRDKARLEIDIAQ